MRGKGEKMNMSTTKRYQDILQELSKTPREDVVKFRNKYEEALKLGAACGSATAFSNDLATKDYIDRLVNEIEVKNIKYDNVL